MHRTSRKQNLFESLCWNTYSEALVQCIGEICAITNMVVCQQICICVSVNSTTVVVLLHVRHNAQGINRLARIVLWLMHI